MPSSNDTLRRADRAILNMTQADIERFWSKVNKTPGQGPKGECWVWTGARTPSGYGRFSIGAHNGKAAVTVLAHRIAFFLANKHLPPPELPNACHSCDFRPCVYGDHLWPGTQAHNAADRQAKGRSRGGLNSKSARVRAEILLSPTAGPAELARRAGCDKSLASRIKNGRR